jgi:hypothetical protein
MLSEKQRKKKILMKKILSLFLALFLPACEQTGNITGLLSGERFSMIFPVCL